MISCKSYTYTVDLSYDLPINDSPVRHLCETPFRKNHTLHLFVPRTNAFRLHAAAMLWIWKIGHRICCMQRHNTEFRPAIRRWFRDAMCSCVAEDVPAICANQKSVVCVQVLSNHTCRL